MFSLIESPHLISEALRASLLVGLIVLAAVWDVRTGRVPNGLTAAAALAAGALLLISPEPGLSAGVMGCVAGALLLLGVRWLGSAFYGRPGMGMGDVKLAAVLGLMLGPEVLWALYLAIVLGGITTVALTLGRERRRVATMVFAPCIALGTLAAVYLLPFGRVWDYLLAIHS